MYRNIIAAVCAILLIHVCVQAQWNWQSPLPQGNDLLRVQFVDTTYGWGIGSYGTIIHTSTGGATWYEQEFARTDDIVGISMISGDEGWAAGDNGTILHTTDNGDDWIDQISGTTAGLNAIKFVDTINGWAAGDNELILHTSNGGASWGIQHQSATPVGINDLFFLDANNGWGVGSDRTTWRTTNAGANWIRQTIGITASNYSSIYFADASLGIIAGSNGVILRTSDGGTNWTEVSSGVTDDLNQVLMQNSFVGWIVGNGGLLLKTINGGQSWSNGVIGTGENLNGIARSLDRLWAVGEFGRILHSSNNGFSWVPFDVGTRLSMNWIDIISPTTAVAVGQAGLIFRTSNAGNSWVQQPSPTPTVSCYGLKFTDQDHGWAIGDNGTILRTTDGGTWTQEASPTTHTLFGISFGNQSFGWIVGGEFTTYTGTILRTTNAGNSWIVQATGISSILYGVTFVNGSSGWAVGENGAIIHTTDGGASWNPQASGTTNFLFWCSFRDTSNGWAVGDGGVILHTSNGGAAWSKQNSGSGVLLYSVTALSLMHVFASGDSGTVLETFDGGVHWHAQFSRTTYSLFAVGAASDASMWACGDYGTIIHFTPPTTGTVSGTVFNDLNNNGVFDPGEPGLPGWKVRVTGTSTDSTLAGPEGTFTLSTVPFGSYQVSEQPQAFWTQTSPASVSYSITLDDIDPAFIGDFGNYSTSAFPFRLQGVWNMIALPLIPSDPRRSSVYPMSTSNAFTFAGGYVPKDTLEQGRGYWIKFAAPQTIWLAGDQILSDTISLQAGWNLIGSINDSVPVASVITSPAGILSSSFFAYRGAYTVDSLLLPGRGYWIRASDSGQLYLHPPASENGNGAGSPLAKDAELRKLNSLTITDCMGHFSTIYFGSPNNAEITPDRYALPPLPPQECFDVRFGNDSRAMIFRDDAGGVKQRAVVRVQSQSYPLNISWRVTDQAQNSYVVKEVSTGKTIASLDGRDDARITIYDAAQSNLVIEASHKTNSNEVPAEFALFQNTPNPFNPSTTITFSLPQRSSVHLAVYNVTGQKIATLAEGIHDAGLHSVVWNASVASGVYFCRFEASAADNGQAFTQVRKMVLLK